MHLHVVDGGGVAVGEMGYGCQEVERVPDGELSVLELALDALHETVCALVALAGVALCDFGLGQNVEDLRCCEHGLVVALDGEVLEGYAWSRGGGLLCEEELQRLWYVALLLHGVDCHEASLRVNEDEDVRERAVWVGEDVGLNEVLLLVPANGFGVARLPVQLCHRAVLADLGHVVEVLDVVLLELGLEGGCVEVTHAAMKETQ